MNHVIRWLTVPGLIAVLALHGCGSSPTPSSTSGKNWNPSVYALVTMLKCGDPLDNFNGVNAYSNGELTGKRESCRPDGTKYGWEYQCVEFVLRYYDTVYHLYWVGAAENLLANADHTKLAVYENGDGLAHPPVPGDIVAWKGDGSGHVAIVRAVRDREIDVIEQNVKGNGNATVPWDGKSIEGRWRGWTAIGWGHAIGAPSTNSPCASSDYNGTQLWTCTGGVLRKCDDNGEVQEQSCTNNCQSNGLGKDDTCLDSPGTGPSPDCASYAYQGVQYWTCAGSTLKKCDANGQVQQQACGLGCVSHGVAEDDTCKSNSGTTWDCASSAYSGLQYWTCSSGNLHRCQDGLPTEMPCSNGCQPNAPGSDDTCKPLTPTGPTCNGSSAKKYCGSDNMSNASADTLYTCPGPGQAPSSSQVCSYGCQANSAGTDDACKPATPTGPTCNGSSAGKYCGNDNMSNASASTLYTCPGPGQAPSSSQVCSNGCQVNSAGTDDACKGSGISWNCANSAYNGQQYWTCSSGNLFKCVSGSPQKTTCSNGCQSNGLGVNDTCR